MHPVSRWSILFVAVLLTSSATAEIQLSTRCVVTFATRDDGIAAITADDPFTRNLSRFDLQARMRTDRAVTLDEWKKFVAGEVRDWQPDDERRLAEILESLRDRLAKVSVPLPKKIQLITTSGKEESGAAYCRGTAIVLPTNVLRREKMQLESLLLHELFHVVSSQNPHLRKALYAVVGFEECEEIKIHPSLAERRITNPDAPTINCIMAIKQGEQAMHAAPVLYSSTQFDPKKEGGLFSYLVFRLMVVKHDGKSWQAVTQQEQSDEADKAGRAVVLDPKNLKQFHDQVGRNTSYIVHPEEILADNFVFLVQGKTDLPTPRIVEELRKVLEGN